MSMFENFPYTNLHQLNLDWIIQEIKNMESTSVLSVNGETGYVILYQNATMELPEVDQEQWQIIRTVDGVSAGMLFDKDGTAYIVRDLNFDQIYTHDNPPPYPVTSVNGLTGDIVLYTDQYVRLPNLTDVQMTNWNFYRHLNGVTLGIQFEDDGKAFIMHGSNRYQIYDSNNPPTYPVSSVNGQTGAVTLYQSPDMTLPAVNDTAWSITRSVNGTEVGLSFDNTGCSLIIGNDDYPLYIQGLNEPSDFDDPEAVILELTNNLSTGTQWGIIRSIQNNDEVGIVFKYNSVDQVYEGFLKVNNTLTKLLTLDDIPSGSGVVSINGQTGAVTLTGSDIHVSTLDNTPIASVLGSIETDILGVMSSVALVIEGDTCTQAISAGNYVYVHNSTIQNVTDGLYKAINSVSANTPIGEADIEIRIRGGLNNVRAEWLAHNTSACTGVHSHVSVKQNTIEQFGNIIVVSIAVDVTDTITTASHLMTVPSDYRPSTIRSAQFALLNINDSVLRANPNNIRIGTDGYLTQTLTSSWSSGYIEALFIYPKA